MTLVSITNPTIQNSETADVTKLTQNDNDLLNGLTDSTKDISINDATLAGELKASDGTVLLPSITFSNDTDTGIYRIGTNNIGIAVGGVKALDVNSSGAVTMPKQSAAIAYLSSNQENINDNTDTKVLLNSETLDVQSEFASYKFTANNDGTYIICSQVTFVNTQPSKPYGLKIYKNGASVLEKFEQTSSYNLQITVQLTSLIVLNSTDYIELFAWHNDGTNTPDLYGSAYYRTGLSIIKVA